MGVAMFFAGFFVGGVVCAIGMCAMHAGRIADDNNEDIMQRRKSDARLVINNGG